MGAYLKGILAKFTRKYPDIVILSMEVDIDHIHLLASIPPKYSVSDVVGRMKGYSSHAMRKRFQFLRDPSSNLKQFWSDGYFASTVGVDEDMIRQYIEHQGEEDRGQAKLVIKRNPGL